MKNANYNLVKVLLGKLDNVWRIEKHYLGDVEDKGCRGVLEKIRQDDKKHIELLREELAKHVKEEKFN